MLGVSRAFREFTGEVVEICKENQDLKAENAKLRDALRALMVGTNAELCAGRDYFNCKECSMNRDRENCTITDVMELLGCDTYGEPMEVEEK